MKRSQPGAQSSRIDLPLDVAQDGPGRPGVEQSQPELPLEPVDDRLEAAAAGTDVARQSPASAGVTPGRRATGALLDLAIHLGALAAVIAGSWWLGIPPSRLSLLPLLLLIGCFSFVYHVLPLTFWGHTPGMANVRLVARSIDGGPLTISQAVRRWLGALLTVASLGLLFAVTRERSVSDRLSGSTVLEP